MVYVNIYFHPEITIVAAERIALSLGCFLVWRGTRFVMRRREGRPVLRRRAPVRVLREAP